MVTHHSMARRVVLCALLLACAAVVGIASEDDAADVPIRPPNCAVCEEVAAVIVDLVTPLEQTDDAHLSEAELGARRAPRRKMMHGRSELRIAEKLKHTCDAVTNRSHLHSDQDRSAHAASTHGGLGASCREIMHHHTDAVGDYVFERGPAGLRDFLCVRLARVCPRLHDEL